MDAATRLGRLEALADLLESSIEEATVGVRAQLAAQYRATLAEIDELRKGQGGQVANPLDELQRRRETRAAGGHR